jgi:hypothetical protein
MRQSAHISIETARATYTTGGQVRQGLSHGHGGTGSEEGD